MTNKELGKVLEKIAATMDMRLDKIESRLDAIEERVDNVDELAKSAVRVRSTSLGGGRMVYSAPWG